MGWPIGQVLGPLIAIPFVSTSDGDDDIENGTTLTTIAFSTLNCSADVQQCADTQQEPSSYALDDRFRDDSQIQVAYWIVAVYLLLMASLFVIMEVKKTDDIKTHVNKPSSSWREMFKPSHWSAGDGKFGMVMFLLLAVFFIFHVGCQIGIMIYITQYAVDSDLEFSEQEGALLNSMLNLSGTLARLLAIFLAPCVSNLVMLQVMIHGELLGALLFIAWGNKTKTGLWVCTIFFGAIHRPIWGAIYVWVNDYLTLLAIVIAALNFSTNFAGVFQVSLYGYLYTETVYDSVFYVCSIYAAIVCFVWYAMYYAARKNGTRRDRLTKAEISTTVTDCASMSDLDNDFTVNDDNLTMDIINVAF